MENYYDILGVKWNASQAEIKAGYREQLKRFHPDVTAYDVEYAERRLEQIVEAYKVLSDPVKRRVYNTQLAGTWAKNQYEKNWKPYIDGGLEKFRTFWDEKIGVEVDWSLIAAIIVMPLLIQYSFHLWAALVMFIVLSYLYYKMTCGYSF